MRSFKYVLLAASMLLAAPAFAGGPPPPSVTAKVFEPIHIGHLPGQPIILVAMPPAQVVGSVPEPATWATMLSGFGMIGAAMRRRRVSIA
jgi:hypothetical protein